MRRSIKPSAATQIAVPRWSPDGKLDRVHQRHYERRRLHWRRDLHGAVYGRPSYKDLTPGRKSTPSWFQWLPSSQRILFTEHVAGETAIAMLDLASGQTERVWKGPESLDLAFTRTAPPAARFGVPGLWPRRSGPASRERGTRSRMSQRRHAPDVGRAAQHSVGRAMASRCRAG